MPVHEPQLDRSARRFEGSGARVLLLGGLLAALGGLVYLLGTVVAEWVEALGAMLAWIAVAPTAVGLVLLLVAAVSHRASRRKPFA